MTSLNFNTSAAVAQQALSRSSRELRSLGGALSAGNRLAVAGADSAGVSVVQGFKAHATGLDVAVRNVTDAVSALEVADGAMNEIAGLIQRMRELAVQSANGTYRTSDRGALEAEFTALREQLDQVSSQAKWNGAALLDGNFTRSIQVGANSGDQSDVQVARVDSSLVPPVSGALRISGAGTLRTTPLYTQNYTTLVEIDTRAFTSGGTIAVTINLGNGTSAASYDLYRNSVTYGGAENRPIGSLANAYDVAPGRTTVLNYNFSASTTDRYLLGIEGNWFSPAGATNTFSYEVVVTSPTGTVPVSVASASAAQSAIGSLDSALSAVGRARATVGAQINTLNTQFDLQTGIATNIRASASTVGDLDYARAASELARQIILKDAAGSVLRQAHDISHLVLGLLQAVPR
jgi:flagellin